jgi:hypothetical protein
LNTFSNRNDFSKIEKNSRFQKSEWISVGTNFKLERILNQDMRTILQNERILKKWTTLIRNGFIKRNNFEKKEQYHSVLLHKFSWILISVATFLKTSCRCKIHQYSKKNVLHNMKSQPKRSQNYIILHETQSHHLIKPQPHSPNIIVLRFVTSQITIEWKKRDVYKPPRKNIVFHGKR